MKNISGFSAKAVLLTASLMVLASCNDTWNDHYSYKNDSNYPVEKIDVTLKGIEGYKNFYKTLATTDMCDKYGKRYENSDGSYQSFLSLLNQDQFLTVWAPSDASIPDSVWAKYTDPNKDDALNFEVGEQFIKTHIARFKHTIGGLDTTKVFMMNGKPVVSTPTSIAGQAYHGTDKNIRCLNGILHCLDGNIKYLPNIYEYITTSPEYKTILGDWYASYTLEEVDESRSVASGIDENGEKIWIDAVMIESSVLLKKYGNINSEDSTYAFLLPSPELWQTQFDRIKKYYVYNELSLNNDSLQKFYAGNAMLTDLTFNMNRKAQRYLPDSVYSTRYNSGENRRDQKPYHIFSHPFDPVTGIFGKGQCKDSIECSNGKIYITDNWPFVDTLTFLRNIKLEAENYRNLNSLFSVYERTVNSIGGVDLESPVRVMRISYSTGELSWNARFNIQGNLKGKYKIQAVILPNQDEDNKPIRLHPSVQFNGESILDSTWIEWDYFDYGGGRDSVSQVMEYYIVNDPSKVDTLEIGVVDLPYCAYDMNTAPLSVTLSSRVNTNNVDIYTSELWLDGIILEPVVE